MCSRGCSSCGNSGTGLSLFAHYGGGSSECGCAESVCFRRILASNYNSSSCEPSLQCIGSSRSTKRRHRLDYAPRFRAKNWWKSGNQCEVECIGVAESAQEDQVVDNIDFREDVLVRAAPATDVLARVEALLAALPSD